MLYDPKLDAAPAERGWLDIIEDALTCAWLLFLIAIVTCLHWIIKGIRKVVLASLVIIGVTSCRSVSVEVYGDGNRIDIEQRAGKEVGPIAPNLKVTP